MSWSWAVLEDGVTRDEVVCMIREFGGVRTRDVQPTHDAGGMQDWRVGEHTLRLLDDHQLGVRVVGWTGARPEMVSQLPVRPLDAIGDALEAADARVRLHAVRAVAYVFDDWTPIAARWVDRALGDEEEAVRRAMARVVAIRRWTEAAPLIRARLDADPASEEYLWALGRLPEAIGPA